MRCLITGGAGFIGSHLVDEALRRGLETVVLDDFSSGSMRNLNHCADRIDIVKGKIQDKATVERAISGVHIVFHHAALVSVPQSVKNPELSAHVNDLGTLNVFTASAKYGVKRVIYASSSAIYGDHHSPPHCEDMIPSPDSPYAAHKLLGEHYAQIFGKLYGLEVVSLRYFNVYGPRQDPSSPYSGVLSIFIKNLLENKLSTIFGDGRQTRDFIFVEDIVRANFLSSEASGVAGKSFNIGTGRAVSIREILDHLTRISGRQITPNYAPPRPGDIYESYADINKMAQATGFKSEWDLVDGLNKTYHWFKDQL